MKKVFKFVKGKRDHKDGGITPSSSGDLLSPAQTPEDERFLGLDNASGYIVDFCGKDKTLTKLHKAAWQGNLDKLKSALKKIDIDSVDRHNRTPLHFAVVQGHPNIVWFLLGNNARHTICDSEGRTPLLKAVECGHKECMGLLLERGSNVNHADFSGNSSLHIAVKQGALEVTSTLIEKGADVGVANNSGEHPLHIALRTQNKDMVQLLLRSGAPVNAVDRENRTPLMLAAKSGNLILAQFFFEYGAQLFVTDSNGWTAEDYALLGGHQTVATELKVLMKKEAKPALESHPEEDEVDAVKSDLDTWNDSNQENVEDDKPSEKKAWQFIRKLSGNSDKEKSEKDEGVESPGSGVVPPPCQPPRSWEIIEAGMIDELTADGSEPKRRSITALGSLHSRRESFTDNHSEGPKYTLSLNRRRDSKKGNTDARNRFSLNEEESLKSSLSDEFSLLSSAKNDEVKGALSRIEKKEINHKSDSGSDWDSNLSSLLESSSGKDKKILTISRIASEVDGTLGRHDTLNEVNEIWVANEEKPLPDPPNPLPLKVDEEEEDEEVSSSWDSGENFHEGPFPPPPSAFELGVDMAKSMSYMKGISIDHAPGSAEEDVVWRKTYEQSQSLDCLDEKESLDVESKSLLVSKQHSRNPSISNQKWSSVELPQRQQPSNRLVEVNKRINDQLECYDQALRELAESSYSKKQDAILSTLTEKKSTEVDNYYSLPSSKFKTDKEFSLTGKTKANSREYTMSLPLAFKRSYIKGTTTCDVNDHPPQKGFEIENNESLGFEEDAHIPSKPTSLDFAPPPQPQDVDNLESPMSDELTGSDKSDRKSKRHMLLAMRDVKHAVQVTNSFKSSLDDQILSPLTRADGEFDLTPKTLTHLAPEKSLGDEELFFRGDSHDLGRQETVIERTEYRAKSSPSDSGDEPTLWLQDKTEKEPDGRSGLVSGDDVAAKKKISRNKSESSSESSPLSNGVRSHRTPSAALRRLQRLGSSSDNEGSVRERTPKIVVDADECGSPDVSLSSGPIDPLNKDSGSEPDSSVRDVTPVKHYSLKKHHKWLKERLQSENKERQKLEESAAQLTEKTERLQYELEDAKEATKSRDEIISLLQGQLNRMEAAYTKSLEESVHCRLQLTTLEQEIFHLKELCSQYEDEREVNKHAAQYDSQCAKLNAKIKQLEEERERLYKEVVRLETPGSGGGGSAVADGGGSNRQKQERCETTEVIIHSQLVQNGSSSLPNSSDNSLKRRNNELESQIMLANEINMRLEEKLDNILLSSKMPISDDINQSILTLSRKNSSMEKQLKSLVQELHNKKATPTYDHQAIIDRLNDEKVLLVKTYEKRLADVSNAAIDALKEKNDELSQKVDQLQQEIHRLMSRPNVEETNRLNGSIVAQKVEEVENKEVPDDSEVVVLRRKVSSLQAALEKSRLKCGDGSLRAASTADASEPRPVREDELAWRSLYGMNTRPGGRKPRTSPPAPSIDKDSEEFIELKVKELERDLLRAKDDILKQRIESDFRIHAIMPSLSQSAEIVELKKKVVDLENQAIGDDALRLSLQSKTAEMAVNMKERMELEFELDNLKMRMQREFVPKVDAEVAKLQADLLARKMSESRSSRAVEDGLRDRLETLARERQKTDALRRRLGRQCVSWEAGVGAAVAAPPFRSLPRDSPVSILPRTSSKDGKM